MDLANCLGVNWLICGDFEPVDASAKCLFWFQKIKIEKQKIEKQLPGRGSLSGRTIIFGLGVSHGPFHLHYAWDLPEISGEAEKKVPTPRSCILWTCLSPLLCPLRRAAWQEANVLLCHSYANCQASVFFFLLFLLIFIFYFIPSYQLHLRLIN